MSDTIAAVSTAPMRAALGVIRISGSDTAAVLRRVFSADIESRPRVMLTGRVFSADGSVIDHAMGVFFKAPKSFTGEDSAELHCHGSVAVLRSVLSALYSAGARPAKPGEFTERAFLSGKMDLTQAEAVIDLIDAESEIAAKSAAEQMGGAIGREIEEISAALTSVAAEFYAFVDYPDDDIPERSRDELSKKLFECEASAKSLAESYKSGRLIRDGVKTALIGCPNVGKSSVLNRLLGCERSIVTDIAGTTRDTVEDSLIIDGVVFRLADTAGIRRASDEPERLGIERSENTAKSADLIIAVFDGSRELSEFDRKVLELIKGKNAVCVINKKDLEARLDESLLSGLNVVEISAKTGDGLDELRGMMCRLVSANDLTPDGKTVTNPRHASALSRASELIHSAADGFLQGAYADLAVTDIEAAINTLGEITGKSAGDAIVSEIFSRFCVGK